MEKSARRLRESRRDLGSTKNCEVLCSHFGNGCFRNYLARFRKCSRHRADHPAITGARAGSVVERKDDAIRRVFNDRESCLSWAAVQCDHRVLNRDPVQSVADHTFGILSVCHLSTNCAYCRNRTFANHLVWLRFQDCRYCIGDHQSFPNSVERYGRTDFYRRQSHGFVSIEQSNSIANARETENTEFDQSPDSWDPRKRRTRSHRSDCGRVLCRCWRGGVLGAWERHDRLAESSKDRRTHGLRVCKHPTGIDDAGGYQRNYAARVSPMD